MKVIHKNLWGLLIMAHRVVSMRNLLLVLRQQQLVYYYCSNDVCFNNQFPVQSG